MRAVRGYLGLPLRLGVCRSCLFTLSNLVPRTDSDQAIRHGRLWLRAPCKRGLTPSPAAPFLSGELFMFTFDPRLGQAPFSQPRGLG